MHILLVNDDGIHAPSLHSLYDELIKWGDVTVVAPAVEQSGVGHSITYRHPLLAHKEYKNGEFFGWKLEGSPADCVKMGILEFCKTKPDVVVSGLNTGANIGINVLYSGTVAAAIEGAFFGIPSFALSQWMDGPPDFSATSRRAIPICQYLLPKTRPGQLWNINFPPPKKRLATRRPVRGDGSQPDCRGNRETCRSARPHVLLEWPQSDPQPPAR